MITEELYQKFGPKLIDAVVRATLTQLNLLRVKAGLPEITLQQVVDGIATELENIPDYQWMQEDTNGI